MGLFKSRIEREIESREKAARGNPDMMAQLASEIMNEDPQRAMALFQSAAQQGNVTALVGIGLLLHQRDPKQALLYYAQAAAQGNTTAMVGIGKIYIKMGDALSMQHAVKVLEEAADKGDVNAMVQLAELYSDNGAHKGTSHFYNPSRAKELIDLAFSRGYEASPMQHASIVRDQDPLLALSLYETALSQGDESVLLLAESFAGALMATECEGYPWSEDAAYRESVRQKAQALRERANSHPTTVKDANITGVKEVVDTIRANKSRFCYIMLDKTSNRLFCECFKQAIGDASSLACFEEFKRGSVESVGTVTPESHQYATVDEDSIRLMLRFSRMMK